MHISGAPRGGAGSGVAVGDDAMVKVIDIDLGAVASR